MSDTNSFASLGPTLLARKGGAKPAMRSMSNAATAPVNAVEADMDDLGWNDLGEDEPAERHEAEVVQLTQAISNDDDASRKTTRKTADRMSTQHSATPRRSAAEQGRRAAFTLRLDEDRHLRLRLASTVKGRSAQILVTEALDQFLAEIPELDGLTAQIKRD